MVYLGNQELWHQPKIAFFASRKANFEFIKKAILWVQEIPRDVCLIGSFHSHAEQAVLRHILRAGKSAIWILGKSIPEFFSREESRALDENRLLILSLVKREHFKKATAHCANDYAEMHSQAIVFGQIASNSFLFPVYKRLESSRPQDVIRIC
ncbi:hypothetical protein [uncultured Fibrobacter sp.]|uniref:hypothetical protein n=1 Tax=uncultured Fibrobacter sp. TaxID=261512 RepID=UPI0028037B10|nr:hypothetical protein [uncultured Fibrobacter sp.]